MKASRTLALEQQPQAKQIAKSNLNNIIELTQQQEPSPAPSDPPSVPEQQPAESSWKCLKYCLNLWRFFCHKPQRLQLDVSDSEFATVIAQIRNKKSVYGSVLPEQKEKKRVLVLDLDETLIHTSFTKPAKFDFDLDVLFNGRNTKIYTVKRFGLEAFLFQMSQLFEIVVFTASQKLYADKVLDSIDPKGRISHRLYRENCIVINKTFYLKNLKILGRNLSQIIIVDDNNVAGLLHPENFYRIAPFDGNSKDRQLCRLSAFLKHIAHQPEITPVGQLRKKFQDMEINLEEVELGGQERSLAARKKQYRHKKTNSEVEGLAEKEEDENDAAETTASELVTKNL